MMQICVIPCPKILQVRLSRIITLACPSADKEDGAGGARESHKAQKVLHEQRRASKPHSNLLAEAKRIWALARQKNIPTTERQKHVKELMDVIRGKVTDIVVKHDASRIVQTAVKYGGKKARDEVAAELKGKYLEMIQSKYSKASARDVRILSQALTTWSSVPCCEITQALSVLSTVNPA